MIAIDGISYQLVSGLDAVALVLNKETQIGSFEEEGISYQIYYNIKLRKACILCEKQ